MKRRTDKNKAIVKEEVELGRRLFYSRGQRSEISGVYLGDEYNHAFCSHIHTKSSYPSLRLNPKNIIIMSFEEHQLWENYKYKLKDLPEWRWVFMLWDLLAMEYYQKEKKKFLF